MALNISLPSAVFSLMETKRWFDASGVAIKDIQTQIQFTSVYVDVSDWVRSIDIDASVNNLSGEPGANRAAVELDNADKRFSDLYAAGPYYGALLPGRPVRIQLSIGVSTVTLFQGRVSQGGFVETRDGNEGTATIEVLDDADLMQRRKFSQDYYYTDKKLVDESDAGNSLLHILLQNHFSMLSANIITNGDVVYTVPYTLFKEGESIWGKVQDIATACLAQYCGFRYDGKFVMESRLTAGWSVPSSEYALVASTLDATIMKGIEPLIGNRVKVRGPFMELMTDVVVWELRKVKPVGTNAVYPGWCWEPVASGDFYLSDPASDPPQEYWAQYEVDGGEIIHVQSLAMSQKIWQGTGFELETTGTSLASESRRGNLVLQNSAAQTVHVMNIQVKAGTAVIKRTLERQFAGNQAIAQILPEEGLSDDDMNWGRVGILSDASSILAYGQTDRVIDSDFICSDEQLEKIADWHLQYGKDPKHRFEHDNLPFMAFMQPGAVIDFSLTELGYSAPVEVEGFHHRISPNGAQTSFRLVETPATWSVANSVTIKQVVAASSGGTGESEIGESNMDITQAIPTNGVYKLSSIIGINDLDVGIPVPDMSFAHVYHFENNFSDYDDVNTMLNASMVFTYTSVLSEVHGAYFVGPDSAMTAAYAYSSHAFDLTSQCVSFLAFADFSQVSTVTVTSPIIRFQYNVNKGFHFFTQNNILNLLVQDSGPHYLTLPLTVGGWHAFGFSYDPAGPTVQMFLDHSTVSSTHAFDFSTGTNHQQLFYGYADLLLTTYVNVRTEFDEVMFQIGGKAMQPSTVSSFLNSGKKWSHLIDIDVDLPIVPGDGGRNVSYGDMLVIGDVDVSGNLTVDGDSGFLWNAGTRYSNISCVITDTDKIGWIGMTVANTDRTVTLPTLADNQGRMIGVFKEDAGTGIVVIDGEGSETIEGYSMAYCANQYERIVLVGTQFGWVRAGGPISPVAGEPSLGTLHMLAAKSADIGGTATVATDIDVSALVPAGARGVYLQVRPIAVSSGAVATTVAAVLYDKDTPGNTQLIGQTINPSISGTTYTIYGTATVKLNANKIFQYSCAATGNNSRSVQIYVLGYYI